MIRRRVFPNIGTSYDQRLQGNLFLTTTSSKSLAWAVGEKAEQRPKNSIDSHVSQ
jgi:hypothetical protein